MRAKKAVGKTTRSMPPDAARFAASVGSAWAQRIASIWKPRVGKKSGPVSKKLSARIEGLPLYTRAALLDLNDFPDPDRAHVVVALARQAVATWCGADPKTIPSNALLSNLRSGVNTLYPTIERAFVQHPELGFSGTTFEKAIVKQAPKTVEDLYRYVLAACGLAAVLP